MSSHDYGNIPDAHPNGSPEIASVGLNRKQAIEKGYEIKSGQISFLASGKA